MVAWGLGLVTVVGVAVAGGGIGDEAGVDGAPEVSAAPSSDVRASAAVPSLDPVWADVVMTSPARANEVISTRDLVVRGHVRESSWRVQVVLQSRSAEPIVVRPGGPMTRPGDRDRSPGRTFIITLPLPDPRPSGPAVVQVVAYDASGRAQDVVLRAIQIEALLGPASGADTGLIARCHLPDPISTQRRIDLAGSGC
jgi:hypothetical protein